MISWMKNWREKRHHNKVVSAYHTVATAIAQGLSRNGLGDIYVTIHNKQISVHDPELYHILDEFEEAYSSLGYRIIPLQDWIDYAGWGVSLEHLWLVRRKEDERPSFTKTGSRVQLPKISDLIGTT